MEIYIRTKKGGSLSPLLVSDSNENLEDQIVRYDGYIRDN